MAREKKFKFAYMLYGRTCLVGNSFGTDKAKLTENQCSQPCEKDQSKRCGGSWSYIVYNIEFKHEKEQIKLENALMNIPYSFKSYHADWALGDGSKTASSAKGIGNWW